jgi:signal transduction histidine kinase
MQSGLVTASSIVQRHRGNIAVESRLGEGSTFTVRLPIRDGVGVK